MKSNFCFLALSWLLVNSPIAAAQTDTDHTSHRAGAKAMHAGPTSDGEVRKIDRSAGKITIKHGPLHNLDMPAMTMVFQVKDPALLEQVKEGDKIRFRSERAHGALTVIQIEVVQEAQSTAAAGEAKQHGAHGSMSSHAPSHRPHSESEAAPMQHGGHTMGGHGMMVDEKLKLFPTIGYDDPRHPRPAQTKRGPATLGDPVNGKRLAQSDSKGRCLNCHVLDKDGVLPGDVGPNLSTYGTWGRDTEYAFQQVWDARAHNPVTSMPPFGTNELLNETEVADIVAYLFTLKQAVTEPQRPLPRKRRERIFVAGVDFSAADEYVDAGSAAFGEAGNNGRSCASCHLPGGKDSVSLSGAASRYPRSDEPHAHVVGLEEQINICRQRRMASDPLPLGSRTMNLLLGYVKYLGRGDAIKVSTETDAAADAIKRGQTSFHRKAGQLNLSCADCHNASGNWLRGQRLPKLDQTAANWPKHYIAAHDLGLINLRQRIMHCQIVTSTYPMPLHSREYLDLEYYLTWLANGSPLLAPTMSRLRGE